MINFRKFGIETGGRTSGRMKTFCPRCHEQRKNKRDKSLSVDLDKGVFNCHYCGWKGTAVEKSEPHSAATYTPPPAQIPVPHNDTQLKDKHLKWLTGMRGLSKEALQVLKVTASLQYMPQTGAKEECIAFNYYEQGKLVNTKFRDLAKNFKMIQGAALIPYNIDAILGTPECIITEGEIDALSFVTAGRTDVISVPSGANANLNWMDRFVETHFEDKQVIYIAVDNDLKGRQLCHELLRRLGAERCRVVAYSEDCKDANDQLVKHGADSLLQALANAPEIPLEGVYNADDVSDDMRALFENGLSGGADTGLANFDRYCTFELGRLCVVTGIPGCGKSEFIDDMVLRLCLRHHWRAAYFSPENMPLTYHFRKLSEKLTGCHFKQNFMPEHLYNASQHWLSENVLSILPKEDFTSTAVLTRARELVRRRGIRILVVDPFNRIEHQVPAGQTETQYISAFIDSLTNFAQRNHCLVILVAHPRKMKREPGQLREPVPTLYDINGSAAFFNKCDFGLVVERDRQAGVTRLYVEKVKFRHLGSLGKASFVYNTVNGRFSPCREDPDATHPQERITNVQFDNKSWLREEEASQESLEFGTEPDCVET